MSFDLHLDGQATIGQLTLDIDLHVSPGELVAVMGANGVGKSTLLQLIAGLVRLDAGHLQVGDLRWDDRSARIWVPPEDRRVGVMFQELRLFGHLSVLENVAFGLRAQGYGRRAARAAARGALEHTALTDLEKAKPDQLSGGQRQRVALARALASEPTVLLLDEPFAAADPAMKTDLRALVKASPAPIRVLVTHDVADVRALADRVVSLQRTESGAHATSQVLGAER